MLHSVTVQVPGTAANLGPGFDTLGLALELHNEIALSLVDRIAQTPAEPPLQVHIRGEGCKELPRDLRNLIYRAASTVFDALGTRVPPLRMTATNRIPLARGLGSSAAAIVGGLVAANTLAGGGLDENELLTLATDLEGHPDNVAAALLGGLVISVHTEGAILARKVRLHPGLLAVLCIPEQRLPTEVARRVLGDTVTRRDAVFNVSRAALLVHCFASGDWSVLATAMDDRLHQPARSALLPSLGPVVEAALRAGAAGAALSGAGPTVLALVSEVSGRAPTVASAMVQAAAATEVVTRSMVVGLSAQGATVVATE